MRVTVFAAKREAIQIRSTTVSLRAESEAIQILVN